MNYENCFIDVGCQYGLHEIFTQFPGNNLMVMIDANPEIEIPIRNNYKLIRKLLMDKAGVQYNFKKRFNDGLSGIHDISDSTFFGTLYNSNLFVEEFNYSLISSTLDIEMNNLKIKPNFIKIDVEGSEESLLNGSLNSLSECWGMVVELSFNSIYGDKKSNVHLIRNLQDLDFDFINFYKGNKNVPQHILVNPVNYETSDKSYGVLTSIDAIFLKNFQNLNWDGSFIHKISHLNFCFNNRLVDLGLKNLESLINQNDSKPYFLKMLEDSDFSEITWSTLLLVYEHLGNFRFTNIDPRFGVADKLLNSLFGINLLAGKSYWEFHNKIKTKNF